MEDEETPITAVPAEGTPVPTEEGATPPAPGSASKTPHVPRWRQLKPAQWEQAVVLWELGKVTASELAGMYGVTEQAIRRGLKARGAKKGCRVKEVAQAADDAAKNDIEKHVERVRDTKERYLGYNDVITKLTLKELTEAARAGVPIATRKDNLAALQKAGSIIARARHENYHLLGLYDDEAQDDVLPELGITEYSPEELEAIQRGFDQVPDPDFSSVDVDPEIPFDENDGVL